MCLPLKIDHRFTNQPGRFYTSAITVVDYIYKSWFKPKNLSENLEKFGLRRRQVEIKIERLKRQLESRIPKGRDLTGENWLETLAVASTTASQDASEAKSWQDKLLTESKSIPFPVAYETNEDLIWIKNEKGRLCVQFNGLRKQILKIYCDQRQLQ